MIFSIERARLYMCDEADFDAIQNNNILNGPSICIHLFGKCYNFHAMEISSTSLHLCWFERIVFYSRIIARYHMHLPEYDDADIFNAKIQILEQTNFFSWVEIQ